MSVHTAPSGSDGATSSWWRLPPENTRPCRMMLSTSGGKKGCGASLMPMTMNLHMIMI